MSVVFIVSTILPRNKLPKQLCDEYELERKSLLFRKQRIKRGMDVPEVKSFIARSYENAMQQVLNEIHKGSPPEGYRVRTFQGSELPPAFQKEHLPSQDDAVAEGFIRTLQIREGVGLLPYHFDTLTIVIGEGENRAEWKFVVVFMH